MWSALSHAHVDGFKDSVRGSPQKRLALFVLRALRFRRITCRQALALVVARPNADARFEAIFERPLVAAAARVGAEVKRQGAEGDRARVLAILPDFSGVAELFLVDDVRDTDPAALALIAACIDRELAARFSALLTNLVARCRRRRKKGL